jgi:adenosylcobinamide-GDP ribazoletransferase
VKDHLAQAFAALGENLRFFTRLPLGDSADAPDFRKVGWAAPLAGAIVGGLGAAVFLTLHKIGLPGIISATVAVAVEIVLTGGLHEDGLADVADGFGGGRDRDAKLTIMRDSRIGTYGAIALCLILFLRIEAITALARPFSEFAVGAFVLAAAAARVAALTPLIWAAPVRSDGAGASIGVLDANVLVGAAVTMTLLATSLGLLSLGLLQAFFACLVGAVVARLIVALAQRQIGGQTGDVCGATAQIVQVAVLLALLIG